MTTDAKRFRIEAIVVTALCVVLLLCAWQKWLPLDLTEALGFATGAACVWLVTRGNIWNWPIGLANNVFFAVLFWRTRLFADFGLQGVYFALGGGGGGTGCTAAPITPNSPFPTRVDGNGSASHCSSHSARGVCANFLSP